jgi:hypothetical protein
MKFGKLEDLSGIEFILPPDHPHTLRNLALQRLEEKKIYMGGTMWNIPKWKGKIFPAKTKADQMGLEYCKQFNTIELNATHYKIKSFCFARSFPTSLLIIEGSLIQKG